MVATACIGTLPYLEHNTPRYWFEHSHLARRGLSQWLANRLLSQRSLDPVHVYFRGPTHQSRMFQRMLCGLLMCRRDLVRLGRS